MVLRRLHIFILLALLSPAVGFAQAYVPGEVIVKLKSSASSEQSYAFMGKAHQEKQMVLKESWGKMRMYHFALGKGQSVEAAIAELNQDPNVEYAEPNWLVEKSSQTGLQHAYSAEEIETMSVNTASATYMATGAPIGVQSVWTNGTPVPTDRPIVAVIDTGLHTTHPVFVQSGAVWVNEDEIPGNGVDDDGNGYVDDVNGWNFVDNSGQMLDDDGHGTHVSGIILSIDQNIYTTPRRQSRIRIMPLKFLNGNGVGATSAAIRAIYYAVNNGATVLNNSWGGSSYSAALHEAVAYTYSKGALFVAAAGNSGLNTDATPMYPAGYNVPNVLAIAATTDGDYLATFSNYGRTSVDLASPGVMILSTIPGTGFGSSSGTSMAAPFAAGTAIQMKLESPTMLGFQLREILMNQMNTVISLNGKVASGGRLNSLSAVNFAKTATVETEQPAYTLSYQADRQLASQLAGGGCGTVAAFRNQPPLGPGAAVAITLILIPVALLIYLRVRNPAQRRKHERFKINSDVRISVGDRELVGSISSISLGGVQVNTSALLQDGGLVTLSISSPTGQEKVEVAGRVVWSEANKAYGVAFDNTPQSVLSRISDWTKGLQKAS